MQQCKSMLRSACHSAFCTDGETGILTEGDRAYTGNRMRILIVAGLTLTASLTVVTQAHAEVHLTIRDGRVTLNAAGATVPDIVAEWAKIGQTKIVNAERIAGGPLTLQLTDVPEEQALDVILRSVSGYVAAPRPIVNAGASRFDRILIMPPSTPPRAVAGVPQPPSFPLPQFPNQGQLPGDDEDGPRNGTPNPRGPIFNTFPQPMPPGSVPPPVGLMQPVNPGAVPATAGPPAS